MLLPKTAAYFADAGLILLLSFLLGWLLSKASKKLIIFGPLLGITAGIFLWWKDTVVIVDYKGGKEVSTRVAFHMKEFAAGDGQNVPLTINGEGDVYIVNETDDVLAVQKEYYGERPLNPDFSTKIIHSHSFLPVKNVPDFFPWENPSDKILVGHDIEGGSSVRTWLRKESSGN